MSQSQCNLRCEELRLVLLKPLHLHQMSEQLAALDKLHQEVDSEFILKHKLHVDQEGVINSKQNVLFKLDIVHLVVFEDNVFADAFHGVLRPGFSVLDQVHFAERAFADQTLNLEVFQFSSYLVPTK